MNSPFYCWAIKDWPLFGLRCGSIYIDKYVDLHGFRVGVGKNVAVDRVLQLLRAEREYVQLHRDTTVTSLTLRPLFEKGLLQYEDAPLVRAAKYGRVCVPWPMAQDVMLSLGLG